MAVVFGVATLRFAINHEFYRYGQRLAVITKLLIGGKLTKFENQPHTP